jgi:hypothetical protein
MVSYQLIQVPAADLHVATMLVHACRELLRRAGTVVAPAAVLLLLGLRIDLTLLGWGGRGAAAEEAADCVADGGTYGDAAARCVSPYELTSMP